MFRLPVPSWDSDMHAWRNYACISYIVHELVEQLDCGELKG